jgi:hypothetical protein
VRSSAELADLLDHHPDASRCGCQKKANPYHHHYQHGRAKYDRNTIATIGIATKSRILRRSRIFIVIAPQ